MDKAAALDTITRFQKAIEARPGWPPKIPHLWPLENPPPSGYF